MVSFIPKQDNIKCSLSKIYESSTQIQENLKENRNETQPKHQKITEEKHIKAKKNTQE